MSSFDSIVVSGEFVSEHYLVEQFPARVRTLRKTWAEREELKVATPRSGLLAVAGSVVSSLTAAREGRAGELPELYRRLRVALGFVSGGGASDGDGSVDSVPEPVRVQRRGAEVEVRAVPVRTASGLHLVVLEAADAATVEDVLDWHPDSARDAEGAGRLLDPALIDGKPEHGTARVISALFAAEERQRPDWVLVQAGGWLLLTERQRWPEGRWVAVDVATAAERRDAKVAGELETIAALVGSDALVPGPDGSCGWDGVLDESVKHAVGVSKDLREGVRESVELVANEIVARRRRAGLKVEEVAEGLPKNAALPMLLQRQALRFLYRILFLLYAEARPELGILPSQAPEYADGYGLDRLRDLALVELTDPRSLEGTHLYESLHRLFRLVDQGHEPGDDGAGLRFEALRADLFADGAISLIDAPSDVDERWGSERQVIRGVGLGNECLQLVLRKLLLSKPGKGRDAGFVSYAQLGINQLGAVYEGLMSYSGFLATEDLYEVAKGGDPSKGTWVVTTDQARELEALDSGVFVKVRNPETGELVNRRHERGSFVFRLSGRERQRSASYYTPEVLTRCVVKHSLAELLDQDDQRTPARRILELTVCEPALGSGAFLIEAVNQLAEEYLKRAQQEAGEEIPPEQYALELQKVKAYLSLHQCYGVDLNATARELAEVSLWLNAMHSGLRAPWFGLHLKRGNSLIGARRAVYEVPPEKTFSWLKEVPADLALSGDVPLGALEARKVHHFLLPAQGWGAVADTREAKELAPAETQELKDWRKKVRRSPSKTQRKRLYALAERVEALWSLAAQRLEIAEEKISRQADVWGAADLAQRGNGVTREQVERFLNDQNNSYRRLRLAMDAWCALWFWPVTTDVEPPDWDDWLDGLEAVLGVAYKAESKKDTPQSSLFSTRTQWADLDDAEHEQRVWFRMTEISKVLEAHKWLKTCTEIAEREGFFHWELDFAGIFMHGGFDLQVGNPPWVQPKWDDDAILAEADPWFTFNERADVDVRRGRRERAVSSGYVSDYLDERSYNAGLNSYLNSDVDWPLLSGQADLYRCFMGQTWALMKISGISGLVHPETHFTEVRAGRLRAATYRRLRRHWHFRNALHLFEEIGHKVNFGVSIYGRSGPVDFLNMSSVYSPETVERSELHDGSGVEPGTHDDLGDIDTTPHRGRIVRVGVSVLKGWSGLLDEPGTPPEEARMARSVNEASQVVLDKLARASRFGDLGFNWTRGWEEDVDRRAGYFVRKSEVVEKIDDLILQGPHFTVATPLAKQPRESMRSAGDYDEWDLEEIEEWSIPRSSYQRSVSSDQYFAEYPHWGGAPSSDYWRLAWRAMADSSMSRTLHATLIPPGPTHLFSVFALNAPIRDLAIAAGLWASIPLDFLVKVSGKTNLKVDVVSRLPHRSGFILEQEMLLRSLRLNCLTRYYEPLWCDLFDEQWRQDEWTHDLTNRPALGDVGPEWEMSTPLRVDFDRRQALVEIDALAAIMLEITAEELCTIYRTQFGVLRKYEKAMRFDANGRQVPNDVLKDYEKRGARADLGRYELPFTGVDREKDMTRAHERFSQRLAARS
ncbi:Eco57I restriction-modification methylase domain-containing protein [Saccharopolyspora gloriosae]|uniref:Eco57I restriction-modification methylase domain-containing protein n=1 Tax=Saccharopolyspora gloriosae TaxID=455344 RepID=UPI001FB799E5|nr:DNA methyltransferase [Saccharopolyspora gloriosae]